MEYKINQKFIKYNRSGDQLKAVGAVLHETATHGATAENEYAYFNSGDRKASTHFFVDWSNIIQTIPINEKAWHAGSTANSKYIGIELCHPRQHNPQLFNEMWKRGVWLFAKLFTSDLNIDAVNSDTLPSHADVSNRWHETFKSR